MTGEDSASSAAFGIAIREYDSHTAMPTEGQAPCLAERPGAGGKLRLELCCQNILARGRAGLAAGTLAPQGEEDVNRNHLDSESSKIQMAES